jgi:hypothetical protein
MTESGLTQKALRAMRLTSALLACRAQRNGYMVIQHTYVLRGS